MTRPLRIAPPEVRVPVGARPRLRPLCYEPAADPDPDGAPRRPPLPAPTHRAVAAARAAGNRAGTGADVDRDAIRRALTHLLRTTLEVFDGRRPLEHVATHTAAPVRRFLRATVRDRRVRRASRFSRIRLCLPRDGVAEVAATCEIDGRVRALAARFELRRAGWCCTAFRLL